MSKYNNMFIQEAGELLAQMESDLLLLEKQTKDTGLINNIFRVMHTLKGSAAMFGFKEMQYVTHEYESIFNKVRDGKLKVNSDLINITFEGLDVLNAMLSNEDKKKEAEELIVRVRKKYGLNEFSTDDSSYEGMPNSVEGEENLYCIIFTPDKNIFGRGINPDNALDDIKETGKYKIISYEGKTSWDDQKADKKCFTSWEIFLKTNQSKTDIIDIFLFYDPEEYAVFKIHEDKPENEKEFLKFYKKHYDSERTSVKDHLNENFDKLTDRKEKEQSDREDNSMSENEPEEQNDKAVTNNASKEDMHSTLNVSSVKLDELLNLVSELVTYGAELSAHAERLKDTSLNSTVESIEKLTKHFRENALDLRLIPVGTLLNKFQRHVRDLSKELNKDVQLIIEGQDTEIDKTILKSIETPLLHIIRNSIDHGLEFPEERLKNGKKKDGLLKIMSFYSGANVIIQVQDDGRGINLEKVKETAIRLGYITADQKVTENELINLILEPGFSTSENVSMVSGRGVGMDVVKKELQEVSGSLEIFTEKNLGTSITLKLPTTLSIIDALVVGVEDSQFLIPLLDIEYCYLINKEELYEQHNRQLKYKSDLLPFVSLREKFQYAPQPGDNEMVIIINKFEEKYAIVVDQIIGEHQAVIKPIGDVFKNQPYFSGGSIMINGELALILDTNYIFTQAIKN